MRADPVRFTATPTRRDLLLNTAALARDSVFSIAIGTLVTVTSAVAFVLGDIVSLAFLALGLALLTGLAVVPLASWSINQRRDLFLATVETEADAAGIRFRSAIGESRHDWSVFRRARETTRAFLLDTGAGSALVVSKRGVDPGVVDAFRAMLTTRGILVAPSVRRTVVRRGSAALVGLVAAGGLIGAPYLANTLNRTATIEIRASVNGSTVSVDATTDLPDGAIVGIQVFQRDEWERELADGVQPSMDDWPWQAYEEILVQDGRIRSAASIAGWPAGRGLVVVYFWVDGRQPGVVIDRFGRDGAGLRGRDVVDDPRNGRTLEVSAPFVIGR